MTAVIILNIVLAIAVVAAIVSLLGRSVISDRHATTARAPARQRRPIF